MRNLDNVCYRLCNALEEVLMARDLLREARSFNDPPTPAEVGDLCGLAVEISQAADEVWRELACQFERRRVSHERERKEAARA